MILTRRKKGRIEKDDRITITEASSDDRKTIYRMRHDVYAQEIGQHHQNHERTLTDSLDGFNIYLTASLGGRIVGFISITPPGVRRYSIDKYLKRDELPFACDSSLFEVRILTVDRACRGGTIAGLLMYAAFRWVEASGGKRIVAIGRKEVLSIYTKVGLKPLDRQIRCGDVDFELLSAETGDLRRKLETHGRSLERLRRRVDWKLTFPFGETEQCYHGGAFFDAIGSDFKSLKRRKEIINADVLDAWFPPAPEVTRTLREHLPWLIRTSPPTQCEGMVRGIAAVRGVAPEVILPGSGSSDLIFLAFSHWLSACSRVLILDPMYGEYGHVLEKVIGCRVDRLTLYRENNYDVDLDALKAKLRQGSYDMVVIVNPNSPTGRHIPRREMEEALTHIPRKTLAWIDETYVEYAGRDQSLERFAVEHGHAVVCKSMSKVYALSGIRAAYLCAQPGLLSSLRSFTPPWAVSLPAQVAAVRALQNQDYYERQYLRTHEYRAELISDLERRTNLEVAPSTANFILCHLPLDGPSASSVVEASRKRGLFVRDVTTMGRNLGKHVVRIAVKDRGTNLKIVSILSEVLNGS
ncbi:MAG: aminotransferase class I/II-fold pyridoxal phosphate-dependent enzyme [Verrucomicrobiota bacterium]